MLELYHVPGTRSVRPLWLCFELELPVKITHLDAVDRQSPKWRQISPTGKVPALRDEGFTLFESGAIVDYLLERYGNGRLQPPPGSTDHARYRQWCWFAEATLSRPLGLNRLLRANNQSIEDLVAEAKLKARTCLSAIEGALVDKDYLVGSSFTAADIMTGYSLHLLEASLDADFPRTTAYLQRLLARNAFARALATDR